MTDTNQEQEPISTPPLPEPAPEPSPETPHNSDSDQSLFMGILAYLGVLVIIPLLTSKENPFIKFHIKQGLVLVICEIILWVAMKMFWPLMPLIGIIQLILFILSIIGIVNVVQKQEKELPLVGSFAKNIKI